MRIEYEDQDLIVIYKEAGLPVQTGRVAGRDAVSLLKNHLAKEQGSEKEPYLGIVHRLDQPVEGLLVFAKTPKAAAQLSRQAAAKGAGQESSMRKVYRAKVLLDKTSFPLALEARRTPRTLTDWLLRDFSNNTAVVVSEDVKGAKRAELSFRTLEIRDGKALLEVELHTGRHHQIRVQLSHAHMPILGDRKYGGIPEDSAAKDPREAGPYTGPLCLCAAELSFLHPDGSGRKTFQVEPSF